MIQNRYIKLNITASKAFKFGKTKYKKILFDTEVFSPQLLRACNMPVCKGECCYGGVWVDKNEVKEILKNKEGIESLLVDKKNNKADKWFTLKKKDCDSPSGVTYATKIENKKCIFELDNGFCTIQNYAIKENMPKWRLKPLYCSLFPFVIDKGILKIDKRYGKHLYCKNKCTQRILPFKAWKEEIVFIIGENNYNHLNKRSLQA